MLIPKYINYGISQILTSFAALHAVNAVIGITFNLLQFIVFSRVFDTRRFSEIVLLTAVGIYALPLSQAIGRANFVAFRSGHLNTKRAAIAALVVHSVFLILVAGFSPNLVASMSSQEAIENGLYVAVCLANNVWYYDLQPTFWALDRGKAFERLTIARRLMTFAALPLLWSTSNFLIFVALLLFVTLAFAFLLIPLIPAKEWFRSDKNHGSLSRIKSLTEYLRIFWPALMSSLTELVVLNSPYALFNFSFGTGPALITYDTIMKLTRITMTVARNLSESALPRLTHLFALGDKVALKRLLAILFGACSFLGLTIALILIVAGPTVFRILLGPNDVLPHNAQYVSAAIVFSACFYTPSSYFLAFNGAQAAIRQITAVAALGLCCLAGLLLSGALDISAALWAYATFFATISMLASTLTVLLVGRLVAAENR